jgi:hypothetical protein
LKPHSPQDLERWEERVEHVNEITKIPDTQLRSHHRGARRAGDISRQRAGRRTPPRVTKVERLEHLVASLTKPWRNPSMLWLAASTNNNSESLAITVVEVPPDAPTMFVALGTSPSG